MKGREGEDTEGARRKRPKERRTRRRVVPRSTSKTRSLLWSDPTIHTGLNGQDGASSVHRVY